MKYCVNKKIYEVESVAYGGMIINVNGTSITDCSKLETIGNPNSKGFTVFVDSDELYFETFEEAYEFATTKQKNTFRI